MRWNPCKMKSKMCDDVSSTYKTLYSFIFSKKWHVAFGGSITTPGLDRHIQCAAAFRGICFLSQARNVCRTHRRSSTLHLLEVGSSLVPPTVTAVLPADGSCRKQSEVTGQPVQQSAWLWRICARTLSSASSCFSRSIPEILGNQPLLWQPHLYLDPGPATKRLLVSSFAQCCSQGLEEKSQQPLQLASCPVLNQAATALSASGFAQCWGQIGRASCRERV